MGWSVALQRASKALLMLRSLVDELDGLDECFTSPEGDRVNVD